MIHVKIPYLNSAHLSQIYEGFHLLSKMRIVNLEWIPFKGIKNKPVIEVLINNKIKVVYDTLDGLNWINGTIEENLDYFIKSFNPDYYFKRSYLPELNQLVKSNFSVLPLGLNFPVENTFETVNNFNFKLNRLIKKLSKGTNNYADLFDIEFPPFVAENSSVLFVAKLYDPKDTSNSFYQASRKEMNEGRIRYLRRCKEEFKYDFIGGLVEDEYTKSIAPDLVLSKKLTTKKSFLSLIKSSNICIATEGLHQSIGWKFAEFVSHSRGIVTEKLKYQLPGEFVANENYLPFSNEDQLVDAIKILKDDPTRLKCMMLRNNAYYHAHVRPDMVVLNTLNQIL